MPSTAIAGHSSASRSKAGTFPSIQDLELREKHALLEVEEGDPPTQQISLCLLPQGDQGDQAELHLQAHLVHRKRLQTRCRPTQRYGNARHQ